MVKHHSTQRFVLKIDTNKLKSNDWNLNISYDEAIESEEIIALADSTCLRFIDNIRGIDREQKEKDIKIIKDELKYLKLNKNSYENRQKIKENYNKLNELLFMKDYICLVANNKSDYKRATKGFYINGIKYVRLLGTSGQLKKSTVVFVNDEIHDELLKRLENDRNPNDKFIPSKYNAYLSLACSSSISVSEPNVIVVKDCLVKFNDTYVSVRDNDESDEPILEIKTGEIENNINDGFGLISPKQAEKWSKELLLDYTFSGCCVRNAFLKGMLFTFDFHDFARTIAKKNTIIDIWGIKRNVFEADIIITESMLKLWNSYNSYEHYHQCCIKNGFTFSITKVTPKVLDNTRNLNYQYLQSYELNDIDIEELIKPTLDNIKDVFGNNIDKTILFLKGYFIGEKTINKLENDFTKALMIDKRMINDSFLQNKLHSMLRRKINDAKIGVLQVNGNFTLISGDPFALCQSMFGLEVSGLLMRNEFYSKYWNDKNVTKVVGFRSPMSCHNNIRFLNLVNNEKVNYWYKYMSEVTIINGFDCTNASLNGCDFDGDLLFTTNNGVLLNNTRETLPIICSQKKGDKVLINNKNLIESDMRGFGDEIGSTTNKITSMFDIQCLFDKDSKEYQTLEYRIMCGQKFQQDAIDKIKGIECKSMPKYWYDRHEINEDDSFNNSIVADKKPYFFIYNYPDLKSEYDKYYKLSSQKSYMLFGKSLEELLNNNNNNNINEEEYNFICWYYKLNPITDNNSTMNKICHKIEKELKNYDNLLKINKNNFDYTILKNINYSYSIENYNKIKKLYEDYKEKTKNFKIKDKKRKTTKDKDALFNARFLFLQEFKSRAYCICNNKYELANIVLDICYNTNNSKQFAWDICGDVFIENLLEKNKRQIKYLEIIDDNINIQENDIIIEYNGYKFVERFKTVNNYEE